MDRGEGLPTPPRWRRAKHGSNRLAPRILALGALALVVTSCGGHRSSSESENVAAVIKPLDNPFFATMRDGLVSTARRQGTRISVQAAADLQDTAGQASDLESLADDRAACYIVNPIDETNLVSSLGDIAAGTPIVNIDSPVDRAAAKAVGVQITTYIGTDNVLAGRMAADAMAVRVPDGARVAVIAGIPGDAGSAARTQGFMQGARGRFEVIDTVAADFDRTRAHDAAVDLIRGKGRLDGIFAVNDQMALGVADAVSVAGQSEKLAVIGMDGIPEALAAVRRGDLSATVAQYPFTIGQLGVEACLAATRGKTIPATVRAPIQLVTERNVVRAQLHLPRPVERFEDPLASLLTG
jgi:ABC-type sugar transport system substrate-binding protein